MPLIHRSRRGDSYYLYSGKTKTGKPRYFVRKTLESDALTAMPAGFEFSESVNGVVSVRRRDKTANLPAEADVEQVRQALARHAHLRYHVVDGRRGEILIYEPRGGLSAEGLAVLQERFSWRPASLQAALAELKAKEHYTPIMRFAPCPGISGAYIAYRWMFRGEGGWLHLSVGPLPKLLSAYVGALGTDRYFELY